MDEELIDPLPDDETLPGDDWEPDPSWGLIELDELSELDELEDYTEPAYNDILVNGKQLSTWGAKSHLDYVIGETPITNDLFQGLNQNNFVLLRRSIGLRTIEINITFEDTTLYAAKIRRSNFHKELYGTVLYYGQLDDGRIELYIPDDGFYYTVVLSKCGPEELVGTGENSAQIKSKYTFVGLRHGALSKYGPFSGSGTVSYQYVTCLSTVPVTNAKIYFTLTGAGSCTVGSNTLKNIPSGTNAIVVDSINKRITVNGQNWMANTTFGGWPVLIPGDNTLYIYSSGNSISNAYIEFYPTYL